MNEKYIVNKKIVRQAMSFFTNRIFYSAIVSTFLMANVALAQSLGSPPEVSAKDEVGVDLISGSTNFSLNDLSIGSGVSSLSHKIATYYGNYFWGFSDDYDIYINTGGLSGENRVPVVGHSSQVFVGSDSNGWTARNGDGSTLSLALSSNYTFTYTKRDGTIVSGNTTLRKILYPNGYEVSVTYDPTGVRKLSVNTNTGLQLKYIYNNVDTTAPTGTTYPTISKIIGINNAVEYCNPTASDCLLTQTWPAVNYQWPRWADLNNVNISANFNVVDAENFVTTYTTKPLPTYGWLNQIRTMSVKDKNSLAPLTSYTYDDGWVCTPDECVVKRPKLVKSVNKDGAAWTYNYQQPDTPWVILGKSTGPKGDHTVTMVTDGGQFPRITAVSTPENVNVVFNTNAANLPGSATVRGKATSYAYDSRQNITTETQGGKISTAEYISACTSINFRWCNKATAIIDAKSNRTEYTYYDEHGQVKSVTMPADKNGVRAQTRYKYSQLYAWYKNASGVFTKATTPVWMLTEENTCSQGATSGEGCADSTKLVVTRYSYGPDSGPNNLWLRGVEKEADGKILRTCYQYDDYGRVIAETAPKAGLSSCQ